MSGVKDDHVVAANFLSRRDISAHHRHADQARFQHRHTEALPVAGHKHHVAHPEQVPYYLFVDGEGLTWIQAGLKHEAHLPFDT